MAPSIWRSKDAQHFQVVHRSQRDPLINDPLAPQHVLKQFTRANNAPSGTSRADLEAANPDLAKQRANVGEAALYGIYFDDTEYDYMQHLRPIRGDFHSKRGGQDEEEDVDTILISAKPNKQQARRQQKAQGDIAFKDEEREGGRESGVASTSARKLDLPTEVLPPDESTMRKVDYTSQMDVNPAISGLQLDMDPHLRQALEALDDEAFLTLGQGQGKQAQEGAEDADNAGSKAAATSNVVDDDVDDFFAEVLAGGEVDEEEFGKEDNPEAENWRALPPGGDEQMWQPHTWTAAGLVAMKEKLQQQQRDAQPAAKEGDASKGGRSTTSHARVARSRFSTGTATSSIFSASSKRKPGQRARLAASVAPSLNDGRTEWSMTSSSMRRNQGLSTLDDQFEALQRRYEQEDGFDEEEEDNFAEEDGNDDDDEADGSEHGVEAVHDDVAAHREAVFDQFLDSTELVGRRIVGALSPSGVNSSASERLGAWREALGPLEERYKLAALEKKPEDDLPAEEDPTFPWRREPKSSQHTWDVETILSTRSNTTNHPLLIRARDAASAAGTASTAHRGPRVIDDKQSTKSSKANGPETSSTKEAAPLVEDDDEYESDHESDATEVPVNVTVTRNRNESAEEKKQRKNAAKEAKQARRQQKSARKAAFAAEHKRQTHMASARTAGGAAADVGRNGVPLHGGRAALTL